MTTQIFSPPISTGNRCPHCGSWANYDGRVCVKYYMETHWIPSAFEDLGSRRRDLVLTRVVTLSYKLAGWLPFDRRYVRYQRAYDRLVGLVTGQPVAEAWRK